MQEPSKRLDPRIRTVWRASGLLQAAVVSAGIFAAASVLDAPTAAAVVLCLILLGAAVTVPHLMYRRWRYEIRERDVYLAKGFLFSRHTLVPFDRIQYVENRQGPLDRLLGLTQIVVYTAAGPSGRIPGLAFAEAEAMREELAKVAGTSSV